MFDEGYLFNARAYLVERHSRKVYGARGNTYVISGMPAQKRGAHPSAFAAEGQRKAYAFGRALDIAHAVRPQFCAGIFGEQVETVVRDDRRPSGRRQYFALGIYYVFERAEGFHMLTANAGYD